MDKCREAFERHQADSIGTNYEVLKVHLDVNERNTGNRYTVSGVFESEWAIWEACWQSRQAEINQLQSQINEMAEVGLSQESAIREKDKRITELEKTEFALAKVKQILNKHIKTRLLESIIVRELIDLLFGNKG